MENRLRVPPILVKVAASLLGKVAVVLPGKLFVASVTPPVAWWPVLCAFVVGSEHGGESRVARHIVELPLVLRRDRRRGGGRGGGPISSSVGRLEMLRIDAWRQVVRWEVSRSTDGCGLLLHLPGGAEGYLVVRIGGLLLYVKPVLRFLHGEVLRVGRRRGSKNKRRRRRRRSESRWRRVWRRMGQTNHEWEV